MSEIWDLLDENGNNTGKTMQKGQMIPEGLYHLGADVWIFNSENKILIQKRSPKKKLSPNVWAMTGGSVIKGETSLETIERETREELGISLKMEDIKFIQRFKEGNVFINTYVIRQDIDLKEIVMQEDEVCEVKWASFMEIDDIVKKGQFIEGRWKYVRQYMKELVEKDEMYSFDGSLNE